MYLGQICCSYTKYSGRQAWANGVDQVQMLQYAGLHYLPLSYQFKAHEQVEEWTCSSFRTYIVRSEDVPIFKVEMVTLPYLPWAWANR